MTAVAPFRDAASETGLIFVHQNGMSGSLYMPEMVGGGVGLLDYDNDGDLDVFFVQGREFPPASSADTAARHVLYRNNLVVDDTGRHSLSFTDVSGSVGLVFSDYGNGIAVADYDRDGDVDICITAFGRPRLLRNDGPAGFADVTADAEISGDGWGTSACWFDFDRDALLDLFVCHYLIWSRDLHRKCTRLNGAVDYCGPRTFEPANSRLYRNLGGGCFEDVSLASGVQAVAGAALGVVAADIDRDGWPDLVVANDGMANTLWMNQRNETFADQAVARGCAFNSNGEPEANMGIVVADFNGDDLEDLFVTHLLQEKNTLWVNLGEGQFADQTAPTGLDGPSRPFTGFGTGAIDFDNDGLLDIFCVNGAVRLIEEQVTRGIPLPLRQRCQLFRCLSTHPLKFEEVTLGDALALEEVGRGAAFGDIDNDGDIDIVVGNNNGPARLLVNEVGQARHWLGLRPVSGEVGRRVDETGSLVWLESAGQSPKLKRSSTDGSYCSASDPRVVFGLADTSQSQSVAVQWPDGSRERYSGLTPDRYHELVKGSGLPVKTPGPEVRLPAEH